MRELIDSAKKRGMKHQGRFTISREDLYDLYIEKRLNSREIGEIFEVGLQTIVARLHEYGIPIRSRLEAAPKGPAHPFYGKHHTEEWKRKISLKNKGKPSWSKGLTAETSEGLRRIAEGQTRKISLFPSEELGYFCGLMLGDGYLYKGPHNYDLNIQSTKMETIEAFIKAVKNICSEFNPKVYSYLKTRRFPNGTTKTSMMHSTRICSKVLYQFLHPYKQKDFRWTIPPILYEDRGGLLGFLQGIFDAEGGSYSNREHHFVRVSMESKHKENLSQIQEALLKFGIISNIIKGTNCFSLTIGFRSGVLLFKELIGFKIPRKQSRLEEMCNEIQRVQASPRAAILHREVPQPAL